MAVKRSGVRAGRFGLSCSRTFGNRGMMLQRGGLPLLSSLDLASVRFFYAVSCTASTSGYRTAVSTSSGSNFTS